MMAMDFVDTVMAAAVACLAQAPVADHRLPGLAADMSPPTQYPIALDDKCTIESTILSYCLGHALI
jgi:hypothetical protein